MHVRCGTSLVSALLISLVLTGCTGFFARIAEDRIVRNIREFVPLTHRQDQSIRALIKREHDWLRTRGFDAALDTLQELRARAARGLTRDDLEWAWDSFQTQVQTFAHRVIPDLARLLATANKSQIKTAEAKLTGLWKKRQKKLKSNKADPQKKRFTSVLGSVEGWVGKLSDAQKRYLEQLLRNVPDLSRQRAEQSWRRQQALLGLLKTSRNAAKIARFLRSWVQLKGEPAELARARAAERSAWLHLILEMDKQLTPAQRAKLLKKIDELIQRVKDLKGF